MVACVTGAGGAGGGAGGVVVVTGATGAATGGGGDVGVAVGAVLAVVDGPALDPTRAVGEGDCVEVEGVTAPLEAPACATAAAAWAEAAAIEAAIDVVIDEAVALAFCAVAVSVATMRRSLASVALSRANFCAFRALCRVTKTGTVVVVVATVGTVAPTKAFASPVPMMATEVTTAVGRMRRRMVDRSSVREVRARLAARR